MSKEYIYTNSISLRKQKKGVNLQYFGGMNLKCNPKQFNKHESYFHR